MFERRPVLGVLGCLTLVLTIWQISPRDVTVYREPTVPYLQPAAPPSSASLLFPSREIEPQRRQRPYGGDDNTPHGEGTGGRRAFGYVGDEFDSHDGTAGTYLNFTAPDWLVAAAAAAAGTRLHAGGLSRRGREGGKEERLGQAGVKSSSSSTQSIASLTAASPLGELLPNDDYTSLIDLTDFKFLINYDYCGVGTEEIGNGVSASRLSWSDAMSEGDDVSRRRRRRSRPSSLKRGDALRGTRIPPPSPPLVLVLIHSAPANLAKRNTIRATWGRPDRRARLIFLMGAVNSTAAQREIEQESRAHDDIVQGSFVDAYRNMTYKHVMALKWFTYHCPGARYVLKTDDDVFVNTPVLYDVLDQVAPQQNLLLCQLVTKLAVKRTHRSKWFVSWREYPAQYYPPHCPGYSILYSPDVARRLYREAQRQPFFWIDDVHITGTVAQNVNVTITPMDGLYLDCDEKRTLLDDKSQPQSSSPTTGRTVFFFTNPNLPKHEIHQLWRAVENERNRVRR
uniref:Hexosyltransferase n=1 Tax=Anopheles atroparvus TaxID=41427 RepID=A0AAG5DEP6_ANOAO